MLCGVQLFIRDPMGASIVYINQDTCAFAPGGNFSTLLSFETPNTIRRKMIETYRSMTYSRTATHVVGWTVYNVTAGLAPPECLGYHNRITEIRKVIDENKSA
ncbi:hypothetical protein MTO96_007089 [Rhipicephalus appendiculatus]